MNVKIHLLRNKMPNPIDRRSFLERNDVTGKSYKMLNGVPIIINICGKYYNVDDLAQAVITKDLSLYDDFVRLLKSPNNKDKRKTIWEII